MIEKKYKAYTIRLDENLQNYIDKLSEEKGASAQNIIRNMLSEKVMTEQILNIPNSIDIKEEGKEDKKKEASSGKNETSGTENLLQSQNLLSNDVTRIRTYIGEGRNNIEAVKEEILTTYAPVAVFDTSTELLEETGWELKKRGYTISVLNLNDPDNSGSYNPFRYLHTDFDAEKMSENILTEKGASEYPDNEYFNLEEILLRALIFYIKDTTAIQTYDKNLPNMIELLRSFDVRNDFSNDGIPKLDKLFNKLKAKDPDCPAVSCYSSFKMAPPRDEKIAVVHLLSELKMLCLNDIKNITTEDNMNLDEFSEGLHAVFVINNQNNNLNYLEEILFSQMLDNIKTYKPLIVFRNHSLSSLKNIGTEPEFNKKADYIFSEQNETKLRLDFKNWEYLESDLNEIKVVDLNTGLNNPLYILTKIIRNNFYRPKAYKLDINELIDGT